MTGLLVPATLSSPRRRIVIPAHAGIQLVQRTNLLTLLHQVRLWRTGYRAKFTHENLQFSRGPKPRYDDYKIPRQAAGQLGGVDCWSVNDNKTGGGISTHWNRGS